MKTKVLIAVVLISVICATAVWTQGGPRGPRHARPGGPGGPGGLGPACPVGAILPPPAAAVTDLTTILELTDQQASDLKALLTTSDATIQPLMKTMADSSKALRDGISASSYDAAAMADAAAKAETAEAAIVKASIETWGKIRGILTADQAAKLTVRPGPGCPPPAGPPSGAPPMD